MNGENMVQNDWFTRNEQEKLKAKVMVAPEKQYPNQIT